MYSLKVCAFTWTDKMTEDGFLLLSALPLLCELIIDVDEVPDVVHHVEAHLVLEAIQAGQKGRVIPNHDGGRLP